MAKDRGIALNEFFESWAGEKCEEDRLRSHNRDLTESIIRLIGPVAKLLSASTMLISKRTRPFISFTKHFFGLNLPVPEVLAESEDGKLYLLSDLGDTSLFDYLHTKTKPGWRIPRICHRGVQSYSGIFAKISDHRLKRF
jgi:aminoglycoside/choline kinase family phosphotransferase